MGYNEVKRMVLGIPEDEFWGRIQKTFLMTDTFSKFRCGGFDALTDYEESYIIHTLQGYFPECKINRENIEAIAHALTEREVKRI